MLPIDNPQYKETKFQYIDALRGIAILMVVLNHSQSYILNLPIALKGLANYGQMGVQLFFIVSAFTLCLSFDRTKGDKSGLQKFYIRRFFRIAPLYYFGIILYFLYYCIIAPLAAGATPEVASKYTPTNIFANLLLMNDWVPGPANNKIVPGGWSIGTETTFYLLFPLLFFAYKYYSKKSKAFFTIPLLSIGVCFLLIQLVLSQSTFVLKNNSFLYFNIISQLPVFLLSMSLYFKMNLDNNLHLKTPLIYALGFLLFTGIAFSIINYFEHLVFFLPITAGLSFVFLFLLFKKVSFLTHPFLCRIGQLSYSIYLFHFIFAWQGSRILNEQFKGIFSPAILLILTFVATLVLSVLLAMLSEKYIEKQGIALGNRLIERIKKPNVSKYPHPQHTVLNS